MSVDYYIRLERGNLSGASDAVLESPARALQPDEAERAHLYDLARAAEELTTRSDEFARRWARHNVRFHRSGVKHLHHPLVGGLALPYEAMDLTADPGLRINVYRDVELRSDQRRR